MGRYLKNNNSIVRQIYLSILRDNSSPSKIIHFRDTYNFSYSHGAITLDLNGVGSLSKRSSIDKDKVRMFLFRFFVGKVNWNIF